MPKRTNDFQRLIKVIHTAMARIEGGRVTESALISEQDGTPREIDILIEGSMSGEQIRIAVECRRRSRKSDVGWIDELVGKYRNLRINKVIAVSSKGFSPAAEAKAQASGIETRSLRQCEETDWSTEFVKLGVGDFIMSHRLQAVAIELAPPPQSSVTLQSMIESPTGHQLGSVRGMLLDCYNKSVLPRIKEFIDTQFLPSCHVLADLKKKLELTCSVDVADMFVHATDGSAYELKKLTYSVAMEGEVMPSEVNDYKYGEKALASVATLEFPEAIHRIRIVQIEGSKQFSVNVEKMSDSSPDVTGFLRDL